MNIVKEKNYAKLHVPTTILCGKFFMNMVFFLLDTNALKVRILRLL